MKKFLCSVASAAFFAAAMLPLQSIAEDKKPKFSASFIQNWYCRNWDKERWEQEFTAARSAGFDSLILQSVLDIRYDLGNGMVQENIEPETFCMFPTGAAVSFDIGNFGDRLRYALEAAKKTDMKLWLGTVDDNRWWQNFNDKPDSSAERRNDSNAELTSALITEMWERYGNDYADQIAGWYYTNEIWNFSGACDGTDGGAYLKTVSKNINADIAAINKSCPEKPLMLSPFYNPDISTSGQYTDFIKELVSAVDFRPSDIYAAQDGGGGERDVIVLREWMEAQEKAVRGKLRFWINNECFNEDRSPKSIEKLDENYRATAALAENNVLFSWNHYYASDEKLNRQFTDYISEEIKGDVNADGKFDIADLVMFQRWLLGAPDAELRNRKAADLCEDKCLDVFDLCLMRKALVAVQPDDDIVVTDVSELYNAVKNAKAGDVIKVASGEYDCSAAALKGETDGSSLEPIYLAALAPDDPPIFKGKTTKNGYVLHILGDYWKVENIVFTNSQKGIVLDNSNHTEIINCEIHTIGAEAIAIRDGSSYCTVMSCNIHDTGLVSPGYGEGVYIGSSKDKTEFDFKCDHNNVVDCIFKNVAAEHVDVKEYTTDTEICGCTFYGDGMTGENYAGSFLDLKGNDCYVHDNIGYRNGNPKIAAAFEVHEQVEGWGYHHVFENNTVYMDQPYGAENTSRRMYVVDGWFSDFTVKNNRVDYGSGLVPANSREYYNSDHVTYKD